MSAETLRQHGADARRAYFAELGEDLAGGSSPRPHLADLFKKGR